MKKIGTIKIGKNLQQIRKSYGYTQEKLAEAIECSARYISDIEQDRAKPSYENLVKICNTFNVSLDDIFSEYLDSKIDKTVNYSLVGFDNLKLADKETIEHLITYFNRSEKSKGA